MLQLINITDVRKYRQLGKQINSDSFAGHLTTIQENQLTEILGDALIYDFFEFLENGFADISLTGVTSPSTTTIKIASADLTGLNGYSVKCNLTNFGIITNAVLVSTDTILTISGFEVPTTITQLGFAEQTKYINLLNGTTYILNGDTIKYNGLRPFLVWNLLIALINDGNLKQSDIGNFSILGENFTQASGAQLNMAKSDYMQNVIREQNRISDFIGANYSTYTKAKITGKQSIVNNDFFII